MTSEHIEEHVRTGWPTVERKADVGKRESSSELTEQKPERQGYVARCGFEIVGVTMRPRTGADAMRLPETDRESEQDQMMSSLVSALGPEHKVTFIYQGGGRTPLRWHIIGEAMSAESAKQADERLRNVRNALMTVLESRKTFYRFKPISEDTIRQIRKCQNKWIGLVQPRGTFVKHDRGPVGFIPRADQHEVTDSVVCLPHYLQDRSRAFSSVVKLLTASLIPLRMSITLAACRLDRCQEQALKVSLEVILDRGPDSELQSHLESAANAWLKTLAGCRIICSVSSARPVSESFLRMLGGELYHGPVDVSCLPMLNLPQVGQVPFGDSTSRVLDLRECIPSTVPLPPLFPQTESLTRCGMRRFFNRENLLLPKTGILMGAVEHGNAEHPVRLCRRERSRHLYILGATGTGKSTLLYNLIMQDVRRGEGVCVVDPHGDLYRQVLNSIPTSRADDVVLLNPCDRERAVGINLLECSGPHREMQKNFVINEVLAILEKLYDMKTVGGPLFEQYFRGALQLIMSDDNTPATLVDTSAVFEYKEFRDALIRKCDDALLPDFWKMAETAGGEQRLSNVAPYIVCKLNLFVHNAMLRPIIGQAKSTIDFRQIMDRRRILLVNLSRGSLGELDMRLLGMVVLTKLICAAMGRLDVAASRRKPFFLYVDEFQNFTTDATASLLSESRKFGLCLTLANQNLAQLSAGRGHENLVHSVLGNVGSLVLFRLGAPDAEQLATYTRPQFGPEELQTLPNFHAAARLLATTGPTNPFVFQTYPASSQHSDSVVLRRIQKARCLYSTSIKAVERDIRNRREGIRAMKSGGAEKKTGEITSK